MSVSARLVERVGELRARFAPDRRTTVWDVMVEGDDRSVRLTGATDAGEALPELRTAAESAGAAFEVERLPDPSIGEAIRAVAHRSLAHLRAEPRHAAELVHQMLLGEEAMVLQSHDEWLRVRTADPYVAWVHGGSVIRRVPSDPDGLRAWLDERRFEDDAWIVVERSAFAREGPEPDAAAVCDLVQGGIVRTGEIQGNAHAIVLPDGCSGWVRGDAVVPASRLAERFPLTPAAALEHAAQFLGLPYLWGGVSEKGFDCSGFVQRACALHGFRLPRDSDQQALVGEVVDPGPDWEAVEDGDLAFFSEREDGRVTHVGFLAAGGRLLHASTTRNGVAWNALRSGERSTYGDRLARWLTGVRRLTERERRSE